jgi:HlyD family secretion protein
MNEDKLKQLRIAVEHKRRSSTPFWIIVLAVLVVIAAVIYYAVPRATDSIRNNLKSNGTKKNDAMTNAVRMAGSKAETGSQVSQPAAGASSSTGSSRIEGSILTVSGYIVAHERIELSPRFMAVVKWIGVKKGDSVTNGQVVVLLDDAEYKARLVEAEGHLSNALVGVAKAELDLKRTSELVRNKIETAKTFDDARLQLDAARAAHQEAQGQVQLLNTYLDWTIIRSPIDGVVLEKLVDPNELVTPQSFGGTRGPSTALIAMANLKDLQVEIDLNESDLSKIRLNQKCKISPEAYPDRLYDGFVAEIAPEASRQKGTLQIKVQILQPDTYLTPELSAKVDFMPKGSVL